MSVLLVFLWIRYGCLVLLFIFAKVCLWLSYGGLELSMGLPSRELLGIAETTRKVTPRKTRRNPYECIFKTYNEY